MTKFEKIELALKLLIAVGIGYIIYLYLQIISLP
jgi:hypothetical protein